MSNDKTNNSRRDFLLKSMTLIPQPLSVAAV
ncbi:Uncharacterised protein [Serratia fonticola]|uniref:Uncharacterized protein n=1 Tax=Serratia fonticola TaxID=47917 RepID=A0A3S4WZL2_SERFO|nr:Uncharacterised protein [Serratia fonticola]